MIVGDKQLFAIESEISTAYERLSFRALGYFLVYIGGKSYGVRYPEASMLACSYDEVQQRIARRGTHSAAFGYDEKAADIIEAVAERYAPIEVPLSFFGLPAVEFHEILYRQKIPWIPDGDEAFDDGSCVLQFDVADQVRLIAYKLSETGRHHQHDPTTVTDVRLSATQFYGTLEKWLTEFNREWDSLPKVSESEDGAIRKAPYQ